jgi:hypothetical protein
VQKLCNFPEAIYMVHKLHCFLEMSRGVPDHLLKYNDTIHEFLMESLLKQNVQKKITDYIKS